MTWRAWLSGCIGALILWLVIGLIFAAGLAVGRATASVPFRWSPAPSSALHAMPSVFLGVDESDRGARSGAPLESALVPTAVLGDVRPAGAPSSPTPLITASPPAAYPTLVGLATWFDAGPGDYAALPGFRTSQLGEHVVVCGFPGGQARCVTAAVVTSCGCAGPPPKVIDLSPALWEAVSGMTAAQRRIYGVVRVTVQVIR